MLKAKPLIATIKGGYLLNVKGIAGLFTKFIDGVTFTTGGAMDVTVAKGVTLSFEPNGTIGEEIVKEVFNNSKRLRSSFLYLILTTM